MSSQITLLVTVLFVFRVIVAVNNYNERPSRLLLQSTDSEISGGYTDEDESSIYFIFRNGNKLIVDMSHFNQPNGYGTYGTYDFQPGIGTQRFNDVTARSGLVTFPGDGTYVYSFDTVTDRIIWNNDANHFWSKKLPDVSDVTGNYFISSNNIYLSKLKLLPFDNIFILRVGNKLEVDMSLAGGRPNANGTYDANTRSGEITFEDDATYSFIFDINKGKIIWNNDPSSEWYKKLVDVTVISGQYKCGSITYTCWIIQKGNSLSVDMTLAGGRPNAYGTYDANTRSGEITFVDDGTYSFTFDISNGNIIWNNDPNNAWYKQISDVSNSNLEISRKNAPILRFDSEAPLNSNGFPTVWDYPNGNINKQNINDYISSIPTYYYVFRDSKFKATSIGYYWYYAYQQQCISQDTIDSVIGPIDSYPINEIFDVNDVFDDLFDSFGSHNNDIEHIIVHLNDYSDMTHITYYQHNGGYKLDQNYIELSNGKANVYIGRIAHGSYHNQYIENNELAQCGYFYDNRDGQYTFDSVENLIFLNNEEIQRRHYKEEDTRCPDNDNPGCNWHICSTNPTDENCIPIKCEVKDTSCLPIGVYNSYEAALDGVAAIINEVDFPYFQLQDVGSDCCERIPIIGECIAKEVVWTECIGSV